MLLRSGFHLPGNSNCCINLCFPSWSECVYIICVGVQHERDDFVFSACLLQTKKSTFSCKIWTLEHSPVRSGYLTSHLLTEHQDCQFFQNSQFFHFIQDTLSLYLLFFSFFLFCFVLVLLLNSSPIWWL